MILIYYSMNGFKKVNEMYYMIFVFYFLLNYILFGLKKVRIEYKI